MAYGSGSRVDFLLHGEGRPDAYVEVKNVHFSRAPGLAEFPDSVTARGARHLAELSAMRAAGYRAVMVYLVQRADSRNFTVCRDLDPVYGEAYERASEAGVEMIAYRCRVTTDEIAVLTGIPVIC